MAFSSSSRFATPTNGVNLLLAAATLALLGGCADTRSRFPSLARRPAERSFAVPPATAIEPAANAAVAAGTDVLALADALVIQAKEADSRFVAREPAAAQRIEAGRNSARGSDAWSTALIALAELESARSRTGVAMTELDRLLVEATIKDAVKSDSALPALKQRHATAAALIAREDARIAQLRVGLSD